MYYGERRLSCGVLIGVLVLLVAGAAVGATVAPRFYAPAMIVVTATPHVAAAASTQVAVVNTQLPTATLQPSATSIATATPIPPTETPVPPTATIEPTATSIPTATPIPLATQTIVITSFVNTGSMVSMKLHEGEIARFPAGYILMGNIIVDGVPIYDSKNTDIGTLLVLEKEADITTPSFEYVGVYRTESDYQSGSEYWAREIIGGRIYRELCNSKECKGVNIIYWPSRKQEFLSN